MLNFKEKDVKIEMFNPTVKLEAKINNVCQKNGTFTS